MSSSMARFDGAAVWAGLSPEQQADIGAAALELVASWALGDRIIEDELGERFTRVNEMANIEANDALHLAVLEALGNDAFEGPDENPMVPSCVGQVCRACGCTENDTCDGGCSWVTKD